MLQPSGQRVAVCCSHMLRVATCMLVQRAVSLKCSLRAAAGAQHRREVTAASVQAGECDAGRIVDEQEGRLADGHKGSRFRNVLHMQQTSSVTRIAHAAAR